MASPVDPRLIQLVPPVRRLLWRTGVAQGLTTALVIARGVLIGVIAASAVTGREVNDRGLVAALAVVVIAHGVVAWWAKRSSNTAVGDTVDVLREQGLRALSRRDPREVQENAGTWRHVLTQGLEDFRPYLTDFLPSLIALVIATPAALITVFVFDWVSGVFALVTLPLIPAFMILIGKLTDSHTKRRLRVTSGLGQQLADLLAGAPTLGAMHATEQPGRQIRETGQRHEKATMGVLRLAFLSSFALEFLATLSVALVAVSIGLRLVYGEMDLVAGLVVLIIVPEVFNPVRQVGTNYHAAVDGLEAAEQLLTLIDAQPAVSGSYRRRANAGEGLRATDLTVQGRDGARPAHLSFEATPGSITVLAGPNGSGKSTVFLATLGVLPDSSVSGCITVDDDIAYLPARPATVPGTVEDNLVLLGSSTSDDTREAVALDVPLDHPVGPRGDGVSAGQLQRIGLSRTLAKPSRVVLLDEPTAHLSPDLVPVVLDAVRARADDGCAIVVASHDHRVLEIADEVVWL
ncbi:ABC transporter ATP-binding protein/permease [Corynebacterium cystitidis]|uniref:ATP-binding cassette, subfamily C, CydD n=1 Tax=Corynebacterium cystitidis DSM 20524 TaxID=1121357 RepID=A0A1H9W2K0_9CORY|nr:ABC transporter transmembrane domain-containing protein [Corynebacterium cystitidis]WJY83007.1 ATP-binding/permease protein CydD [Corynebacterium cystitidis DSM 20524]SES28156.1 ATP-binding cassette, subfamily C, CydD [Corynebacterium cystitidis DSM 20524]SNV64831.1 ATP-binding/permease protein cydD [Corynebacterium cystitidis]